MSVLGPFSRNVYVLALWRVTVYNGGREVQDDSEEQIGQRSWAETEGNPGGTRRNR